MEKVYKFKCSNCGHEYVSENLNTYIKCRGCPKCGHCNQPYAKNDL